MVCSNILRFYLRQEYKAFSISFYVSDVKRCFKNGLMRCEKSKDLQKKTSRRFYIFYKGRQITACQITPKQAYDEENRAKREIIVSNMSTELTCGHLKAHFSKYGNVTIVEPHGPAKAVVRFKKPSSVEKVLLEEPKHPKKIYGYQVNVCALIFKPKEDFGQDRLNHYRQLFWEQSVSNRLFLRLVRVPSHLPVYQEDKSPDMADNLIFNVRVPAKKL